MSTTTTTVDEATSAVEPKPTAPAVKKSKSSSVKTITAARADLLRAVEAAARVTGSGGMLRSLQYLELTASNCRAVFRGTDLGIQVTTEVKIAERHKVSALLPAKLFVDTVKACPDGEVVVTVDTDSATVTAGDFTSTIRLLMEELPKLDLAPVSTVDVEFAEYPAFELAAAIRRTLPMVSKDGALPALASVYFDGKGAVVGTDRYRLIRQVGPVVPKMLVPSRLAAEIVALVGPDDDTLKLAVHGDTLAVRTGLGEVVGRLTVSEFVAYENLVEKAIADADQQYVVDRDALATAIGRCRPIATSSDATPPVRLCFSGDGLVVTSMARDVGEAEHPVPVVEREGDDITVAVNVDYARAALAAFDEDDVTLLIADQMRPMLMHGGRPDDKLVLLMPVRLS